MTLFRSLCSPLVLASLVGCSPANSALLDGSSPRDAAALDDAGTSADLALLDGSSQSDASDGSSPPLASRLFVSHMGGVAIWDHPEQLTADVAPNVQLTSD